MRFAAATWLCFASSSLFCCASLPGLQLKEKDKRWLESEIEILQSVNHTNICRLIEVFETGDKLYLVLEMLRGGDLLARVSEDPDFTQKDTADVIRTVAGVLRYIHAKGIIHRDIKPQNLVYRGKEKGSQLVVTDFGLSKHMAVDDITYTACGTPLYLAPEVILKSGYGKECDMWSLGVLLYVLLTGYFPFYSRTRHKLYSKVLECRYKWPKEAKDVPPEAKDLVSKLLCVDPKKRSVRSLDCGGAPRQTRPVQGAWTNAPGQTRRACTG